MLAGAPVEVPAVEGQGLAEDGDIREAATEWTVVKTQHAWLEDYASKWFKGREDATSIVVSCLIKHCNAASRASKKQIFRTIRCHNCSQASTGGTKTDIQLRIPAAYAQWISNVQRSCDHPTADKTMRILLAWYIGRLCTTEHKRELVDGCLELEIFGDEMHGGQEPADGRGSKRKLRE